MLIQEVVTDLEAKDIIAQAKEFFTMRLSNRAAFLEEESEVHVKFEIEAGEVLIAVAERDGRTVVRGSTARLHNELSRFLMTIAPAVEEVRQSLPGPGTSGAG